MSAKLIYCEDCRKYLGEIREATLRTGIIYLCAPCNKKRLTDGGAELFASLFGTTHGKEM